MTENEKKAALSAAQGIASALDGNYIEGAAHFLRGALELAEPAEVRKILDAEAFKRANAIADAIAGERFR